jgi:hypothetical protein
MGEPLRRQGHDVLEMIDIPNPLGQCRVGQHRRQN